MSVPYLAPVKPSNHPQEIMHRFQSLSPRVIGVLLLAMILCSCGAQARKARSSERAERYFNAGEYDKAKIEYLNLLRLDPKNALAFQRLGTMWAEEGAPLRAGGFLIEARKLTPGNVANRIKLAQVFMSIGQLADARKEVVAVLQVAPDNGEAIMILSRTCRTLEDVAATEQQLQKFPQHENAYFQLASANLSLRKGDPASAETALRRALALDPKLPSAHTFMGTFYLLQKNRTQAEQEFKTAAELAPVRSSERIKYAEFRRQTGGVEEAKGLLKGLTAQARDFLSPWSLLAEIALAEKKYDESLTLLQNVFSRDAENIDARVLEAKVWLAKGETKRATEDLERLDHTYRTIPSIKYFLALAYSQSKNSAQAITTLTQAVALNPDFAEAILLLAELQLRAGNPQPVVAQLTALLKKRPDLLPAQLLLAEAYRSLGQLDDSAAVVREQIKRSPQSSQSYLLLGLILRQQNKSEEARKTFEKALELAPDSLPTINELVELDISNKNFHGAMLRVQDQLQKTPKSASVHFMEAKIYAAQRQWDRTEAALLTTLDLDPNFSNAYDLLISTYIAAKKLPQAISQLEAVLSKSPDNTRSLMTLGLIYDQLHDFTRARDAYEKLLATTPDFAPALNNLAYLYGEHLGQLDKAYELARKARQSQPADPAVADTLGWIVFKRGDYQQALTLLQESAGNLPNTPEIQFHLGMANYMMGQTDAARTALQRANNAPVDFPGKAESQRRLALLGNDSSHSKELSIDELEALLKQQPNDLVALVRLGELYEKQGSIAKAAATYEQVIKINPKLLSVTIKLAQLNAGQLQNKEKAFEFAKKARELAPNDPHVAASLGSIAYQTDNFSWAYSLLQESGRQLPDDPAILYDYAWTAYSLGRVDEAQQIMQGVIKAPADSRRQQDATLFLAMTALDQRQKDPAMAEPEVERLLKTDPVYVPALMAQAAINMQRGESKAATDTYTRVLQQFPDFAPAQKHLAALYVEDPKTIAKAYDMAVKARKTLPDDPELAQTLAEISYQRQEYAYALQLFEESAKKKPLAAKALYYLGICHLQAKQSSQGRDALHRALAAGLQEPFATEAKRAIEHLH
jgi:tetratricopeptide (TPR) repeat protein